jgi:hypothetical protein
MAALSQAYAVMGVQQLWLSGTATSDLGSRRFGAGNFPNDINGPITTLRSHIGRIGVRKSGQLAGLIGAARCANWPFRGPESLAAGGWNARENNKLWYVCGYI